MSESRPSKRLAILGGFAVLALGGYLAQRAWAARQPLEIGGMVEVRTIQVASRVGGRVLTVAVHEGDRVHSGQVLVALEPSEILAKRAEAQAAVALADALLQRAVNGPRAVEIEAYAARQETAAAAYSELARGPRQEDIARARAQLAAAESQAGIARETLDRDHGLLASGALSQAEYDSARATEQTAVANRDAARDALDALVHGNRPEVIAQARAREIEARAQWQNARAGSREEDIRAARAQLAEAQAKLAQAEIDVTEANIVAPTDCVVEALDLRPGDILGANQTAATLVEDDQMFVRAYVPETELGLVRVGQRLAFTVDTYPSHPFHAAVQHVNQVGEYTPRNVQTADERADEVFLVRLGITEGRGTLRAGMSVTVRLPRRAP